MLDWAHAYESFATGGKRDLGLARRARRRAGRDQGGAPASSDDKAARAQRAPQPPRAAGGRRGADDRADADRRQLRHRHGAPRTAASPPARPGTTENFGDAWFVGFTEQLTIAVWVGYPDETRPMKTEFAGEPVAGGTFPALIWRDFVTAGDDDPRAARRRARGQARRRRELGRPSAAAARQARAPRRRAIAAPAGRRRRRRRDRTTASPSSKPRSAPARRAPSAARARDAPAGGRAGPRGRARAGPGPGRRRGRLRRRQRAARLAPRPIAPAVSASPRACRRATASKPGGRGRETWRAARAQKRHGSSTARVIPIRGPHTTARGPRRRRGGSIRTGPRTRLVALRSSSIPSACVSLPGTVAQLLARAPARGARASTSSPSSGSSARISTAAPDASPARRPRSAARGSRTSGRRRPCRARRTAPARAASGRRTRGRPARCSW